MAGYHVLAFSAPQNTDIMLRKSRAVNFHCLDYFPELAFSFPTFSSTEKYIIAISPIVIWGELLDATLATRYCDTTQQFAIRFCQNTVSWICPLMTNCFLGRYY